MESLVSRLAQGERIAIHGCSLHPDIELDMIWGVDPYGQDFVACTKYKLGDEVAAQRAIAKAQRVGDGDNTHDIAMSLRHETE